MTSQKSELYKKVKEYVKSSYTKDGVTSSTFNHQVETAEIVRELNSSIDESIIIAALSHDIERAFRQADMFELLKSDPMGFKSSEFLKRHQERGAEIMGEFLKKEGQDKEFINEIKDLISRHEVGGTKESDLLRDSDSLSFFRSRALHFVETKIKISSAEKVKLKLDWMFERIGSSKVKELAKPLYEKAIEELEKV